MSKCRSCPIAGACVAERPGHGFACRLATGTESERRWVAEASSGVEPEAPKPAYPPLAKQAVNLGGSIVRFVGSGGAVVDQAEFDRRRSICQSCPSRRYVEADDRCEACGCYVSVKPWSKAEKCPEGHW